MKRFLEGGLIFAIGLLVGWLVPFVTGLRFSKDVDVGNFLNALATLIVAFVIGYLYASQVSSKRADTDLVLDTLRETKAAVLALQQAAIPCHAGKKLSIPQQTALTQAEREVSNAVHSVEHALRCCRVKVHRLEFEKLKDARSFLKDSLTDTPFPGPYDNASRTRIQCAFKSIRDELVRLSFAISRR